MATLPVSDDTLFVRTCFDDPDAWSAICEEIHQPADEYAGGFDEFAQINAMIGQDLGDGPKPYVMTVDDPAFAEMSVEELIGSLPAGSEQMFLIVADRRAMTQPDHPVLIIDVFVEPGRTFRAVPAQIAGVENNLSLANLDWEDFANHVDDDGVFRGFSE